MISNKTFPQILGIGMTFTIVIISVFVWLVESHQHAEQSRLATNIGEIKRIDEVLSSSALLAATTGDAAYEVRYLAHVGVLDRLLTETMLHFSTDETRAMLGRTEDANRVLVDIETRALDMIDGAPNPAAYSSLRSPQYLENKKLYLEGTEQAFAHMQHAAAGKAQRVDFALVGLAIASILMTAFASRLIWKSRMEMLAHRHQDAQVDLMRATIRTFMDVQNNLLKNMVYFRTKAAHNLPFDHREIELIDGEIDLAKQKLADIADTGIGEVRDLGGIVVMAPRDTATKQVKREKPELSVVA